MTPETTTKLIAASLPALAVLLSVGEWIAFRVSRSPVDEPVADNLVLSRRRQKMGYAAFVALSLVEFPIAFYTFALSLVIPPWQILWTTAAAMAVTGLAGILTAIFIFFRPVKHPFLIYATVLVNLVVLLWAMAVLAVTPGKPAVSALFQPSVRAGANRFRKRLFVSVEGVGALTDIQDGELRSPGKIELGVAGNYGARFFDETGRLNAALTFEPREHDGFSVAAKILKQSGSNGVLFFRQAGAAATYDSLADSTGKEIWRTPYHAVSSTFGDLRAGGVTEFIFATDDRTLEARSISGAVTWHGPRVGYAFSTALVDGDGSPTPFIVVDDNDSGGELIGIRADGSFLFRRKPSGMGDADFFSSFSTVLWPTVCANKCLLVSEKQKFMLLTTDGTKAVKFLAPARYAVNAIGQSVRLFPNAAPVLAVAGELPYQGGKSVGLAATYGELYLFDLHGDLIYDEVLAEPVEALGVLPAADGKTEALLVGGENKAWEYSASSQGGASPPP